jgi:hypothetical protein
MDMQTMTTKAHIMTTTILNDRKLKDLVDHLYAVHDRLEAEAGMDGGIDVALRRTVNDALAVLKHAVARSAPPRRRSRSARFR